MAYFNYHDEKYNQVSYHKVYVDVVEIRKSDGTVEPKEIVFGNKRYPVEKFEYGGYGSSRAGGGGRHFTIWIAGRKREMFLEKDRYFIEAKGEVKGQIMPTLTDEELNEI